MTALWIVIALIVLFALAVITSYNRFVRQRNLVQESWRQIDVELNRVVVGASPQEMITSGYLLQSVTEARSAAVTTMQSAGSGVAAQSQAETQLGRALGGLFAVAENYPDLKSSQNFLALQQQLAETEDRIAAGRRFYNGNVRGLNTRVEAFPSSVIAGLFHFTKAEYFEVDDPAVRAPVTVDFSSISDPAGSAPPQPPQPPAQPPQMGQTPT